jgi:hypothetical protein
VRLKRSSCSGDHAKFKGDLRSAHSRRSRRERFSTKSAGRSRWGKMSGLFNPMHRRTWRSAAVAMTDGSTSLSDKPPTNARGAVQRASASAKRSGCHDAT